MLLTTPSPRRGKRIAIRVFLISSAVVLLAGIIAGGMYWYVRAYRVTATAVFRVAVEKPAILVNEASQQHDGRNYDTVKKSQLAAIKSYFVLTAAVRDPEVGTLRIFDSAESLPDWLEENLVVEYPSDGEYLTISLSGPQSQTDELIRVVDAVADAYRDEVVYKQQATHLGQHDLLKCKLEELKSQIARKTAALVDVVAEANSEHDDNAKVPEQPGVIFLDPYDQRSMALQGEPEGTEPQKGFGFDQQFDKELRKRLQNSQQEQTVPNLAREYSAARRELLALEKIATELTERIKRLDIEVGAAAC